MNEQNDQNLQNHAGKIKRQAEQIDDQRLDSAIRAGIHQAHQQRRSHRKRVLGPLLGAAAALIILLGAGTIAVVGQEQASEKVMREINSGEVPEYVSDLNRLDMFRYTLQPAIEHGLYQPLNQKLTQGNYKIQLDGVVADSQRVIVLYTIENTTHQRIRIGNNVSTALMNTEQSMVIGSYYNNFSMSGSTNNVNQGAFVFDFTKGNEIPAKMVLSLEVSNGSTGTDFEYIRMPFAIDTSRYKGMERIEQLHRTYAFQDYSVQLSELRQTPLRTELDYTMKPHGGRNLSDVGVDLLVNEPNGLGHIPLLQEDGSYYEDGDTTHLLSYYTSTYFEKDQSLWINFARIKLSQPEPFTLTIDTRQKKIINSSDTRTRIKSITKDTDKQKIRIGLTYPSIDPYDDRNFIAMDTFTDASGKSYKLQQQQLHEGAEYKGYEISIDSTEKYHQPLTFKMLDDPSSIIYPDHPFKEQIR
ncbi:DUF4179 domain-containing protein [Paenibacillus dauci]|uniref:DUF4179 domain-containing protein n=1 Tax=Paenibacillus dauci TaxID=1567106 RepID=UPI000619C3D1|nr:DUF4179 domain-containing protein [Paenibacillus dauci]